MFQLPHTKNRPILSLPRDETGTDLGRLEGDIEEVHACQLPSHGRHTHELVVPTRHVYSCAHPTEPQVWSLGHWN